MRIVSLGMFDLAEIQGGLDRYRVELERALRARGHEVLGVYASRRPSAPGAFPTGGAVRTVVGAALASRRVLGLGGSGADVVAAHFALTGLGALCGLGDRGAPWVVHFHGPWAQEVAVEDGDAGGGGKRRRSEGAALMRRMKFHAQRTAEHWIYRRARAVLTLSRAFADIATGEYGVPAERVVTVPPGIDLGRFRPGDRTAARQRLGLPARGLVLLTVRRLRRRMGLETLLEAVARLPSDGWRLLVAGEGALRPVLERRVRELGLSDRVRLLGRVPEAELPELYRAADLFVLPSEALEGFGMVIPEALASGVPVLATPVGGIPEALAGVEGALLPRAGDPGLLAEAIGDVLAGRRVLPPPGEARRYAEMRFSWDAAARRVEEVYASVAGGRMPRRVVAGSRGVRAG